MATRWAEKVAGGWTSARIFNYHSGFPFNPTYGGIACNAFYPNSGNCNLRPASYKGGAGTSQSTDTFKTSAGHYANGGTAYFTAPAVVSNTGSWNTSVAPRQPHFRVCLELTAMRSSDRGTRISTFR